MAEYRGVTTAHGDQIQLTVEARRRCPIDAKTAKDLETPPRWQWLTVATHLLPRPIEKTPSADQLLLWARHHLHAAGWKVVSSSGQQADDLTLQVTPSDFPNIIEHVNARREAARSAADQADMAWRTVLGDVPALGEPGYVSKARVGEITSHSRMYIEQVWKAERAREQ